MSTLKGYGRNKKFPGHCPIPVRIRVRKMAPAGAVGDTVFTVKNGSILQNIVAFLGIMWYAILYHIVEVRVCTELRLEN